MASPKRYWLMKSEPWVFSIDDLKDCKVTCWDGVRNYQARNYMRDEMRVGDRVFFYHSNAQPSGIAGLAEVVKEGYSDPANPTWYMVDVKFVKACRSVIPLNRLRQIPGLKEMVLFRNGRLSVQPVTRKESEIILGLPEWD